MLTIDIEDINVTSNVKILCSCRNIATSDISEENIFFTYLLNRI